MRELLGLLKRVILLRAMEGEGEGSNLGPACHIRLSATVLRSD
jgi:hypothetical protein